MKKKKVEKRVIAQEETTWRMAPIALVDAVSLMEDASFEF